MYLTKIELQMLDSLFPHVEEKLRGGSVVSRWSDEFHRTAELRVLLAWAIEQYESKNIKRPQSASDFSASLKKSSSRKFRELFYLLAEIYFGDEAVFAELNGFTEPLADTRLVLKRN